MGDILTGTPEHLTYGHDLVKQAWMVVWAVTSAALVVIVGCARLWSRTWGGFCWEPFEVRGMGRAGSSYRSGRRRSTLR